MFVYLFQVKFFQCYLIAGSAAEQNPPRCLHKWSPHGGKPVSFIHFLDDHKEHNPEVQFWKFAVTGELLEDGHLYRATHYLGLAINFESSLRGPTYHTA